MCRMLSKVSSSLTGIMQELEQCPNSLLWLSENGIKSHNPDVRGRHNDGCGMAYINAEGELMSIKKGKTDFWDRSYHDFAAQAQSKLYIAHNRFASEGLDTGLSGAHPFTIDKFGQTLAFCHNGGVDSYMQEAKARNTSDSEIYLERLVEKINELNIDNVVTSIEHIATSTKYSSLCAFLLTGNEVYIWRIFDESDPSQFDRLSRYYTLYMELKKGETIVASEPLDNGNWLLIPNKTLLCLRPANSGVDLHIRTLNC